MSERISDFLESRLTLPLSWPLALLFAILVLGLLAIAYRAMFRWLGSLAKLSNTDLDDLFVKRMRLPAKGLVILVSSHVFLALQRIQSESASKAIAVTELLLIAYLVIEALETAVLDYWLRERKKLELPAVVRHLIMVVAYSLAVISVVGAVTGVNLAPLIATSTVITVVLGLALQDTLGNLFSGLALSLEKPFSDGDWILVDGIEGQVIHLGWRSTHLKTLSFDIIAIPNAVIAKARVQNFSAPEKLTARNVEIPVALEASPQDVERVLREALLAVDGVLPEPPAKVWLVGLTPLFARYVVKFSISDFRFHDDLESNALKAMSEALKQHRLSPALGHVGIDERGRPAVVVR